MATKPKVRNLRPSVRFRDQEQAEKAYVKAAVKNVKITQIFQDAIDRFLAEK